MPDLCVILHIFARTLLDVEFINWRKKNTLHSHANRRATPHITIANANALLLPLPPTYYNHRNCHLFVPLYLEKMNATTNAIFLLLCGIIGNGICIQKWCVRSDFIALHWSEIKNRRKKCHKNGHFWFSPRSTLTHTRKKRPQPLLLIESHILCLYVNLSIAFDCEHHCHINGLFGVIYICSTNTTTTTTATTI